MKNNKLFHISLAVFLIVACALVLIPVFSKKDNKQEIGQESEEELIQENIQENIQQPEQEPAQEPIQEAKQGLECVTSVEERTVRGSSLKGIIEPEEKVIVYFGYYRCNDPKRGDMVLIDYAGNDNPIMKIIKGVPGDSFSLKQASGGWNIMINGEPLKNSQEKEYVIDQGGYRMLSLYARDYEKIPENAFLVMGNLVGGTTDSTAFGLVGKNDIIGKAYASSSEL